MTLGNRASHILKEKTGPDDPELVETLLEALGQVAAEDLVSVADELVSRQQIFLEWVEDPQLAHLSHPDVQKSLFRSITHSKRHAAKLTAFFSQTDLLPFVRALLFGEETIAVNIEEFASALQEVDQRLGLELATGLMHYAYPGQQWLWTRWMWDASKKSGILPLIAGGTHNLIADSTAEGYLNVGSVSAMSAHFAEGTGLMSAALIDNSKRSPFAIDVFLACSYSVYLYGVTTWRLSREFNNLLPTLPNLMRRLLGLISR